MLFQPVRATHNKSEQKPKYNIRFENVLHHSIKEFLPNQKMQFEYIHLNCSSEQSLFTKMGRLTSTVASFHSFLQEIDCAQKLSKHARDHLHQFRQTTCQCTRNFYNSKMSVFPNSTNFSHRKSFMNNYSKIVSILVGVATLKCIHFTRNKRKIHLATSAQSTGE